MTARALTSHRCTPRSAGRKKKNKHRNRPLSLFHSRLKLTCNTSHSSLSAAVTVWHLGNITRACRMRVSECARARVCVSWSLRPRFFCHSTYTLSTWFPQLNVSASFIYLFTLYFFADGCSLGSAVHSVTIALRHFALGVDPTAAYWDFDLLDGHGGWRAEGCHITGSGGNTTTIHCTHHNNFAVLMVSRTLCGTSVIHSNTTMRPPLPSATTTHPPTHI